MRLGVGPLPVLQTLRAKEPFSRHGGIQKERVIVPWTGRRCWVTGVSSSDAAVLDGLTSLIFFGFQIVWNKSTRRAAERGGARVGRPRWVSILTMTGGSSIGARRRFHQDLEEPAYSPRALWQRLLGRPASESGTLRHGDGTHGRSARCRG